MKLPDGPQTLPLIQLIQWITRPLEYLDTGTRLYGECFTARLGSFPPTVLISDPHLIEKVFTAPPQTFDAGRANSILRPTLGDNSLLLLDGARHQRQRQLLMPPFHGERMRAYGQLIWQITEQVTRQWVVNSPFTVRPSLQEISLRVILQAVFGLSEGQRYQQIQHNLVDLLDRSTSAFGSAIAFFPILQSDLGAWSPGGKFNRLKRQIDQLIYAEIHERREQSDLDRSDILSLLMAARDEAGEPMTDQELRDELMTLLLAGHETTATALAWALYWIHHQPQVKEKLMLELGTLEADLDINAIARLPYLNAVCSETLRIYPIGLIVAPRIVKSSLKLMDYEFEPGVMLAPCIYSTHRREDLYPEAEKFKPERFLERQFSPYEFFAFGGGSRRCIGAAFALFEMKLVLVNLLLHFDLTLVDDRPIYPVRRGVTMAPAGG